MTEVTDKFRGSNTNRAMTWDELRIGSTVAQSSNPKGLLVSRVRLGRKPVTEDVQGPDFRVKVTQNRLSSKSLGTGDELKVVLVQ